MSDLAADGRDEVREVGGTLHDLGETVVAALPRAAIAVVVLALFVGVARLLRPLVQRRLARRRTPSFSRVMSRLAATGLLVVGTLLAVTIVFPSVRPVDLVSGAGIVSVAAGFAFKDILQNLLAGILLLFRQPFRGGDQIQVGEVSGSVEEINVRETVIRTFDGRRVLVPNATVYTDVIEVQTAHPTMRIEVDVGVAYGTDVVRAVAVALQAARSVEGVAAQPAPEALVAELGASSVLLEVLVWCSDSHQIETRRVRSRVTTAVLRALDADGIDIPPEMIAIRPAPGLRSPSSADRPVPAGLSD